MPPGSDEQQATKTTAHPQHLTGDASAGGAQGFTGAKRLCSTVLPSIGIEQIHMLVRELSRDFGASKALCTDQRRAGGH